MRLRTIIFIGLALLVATSSTGLAQLVTEQDVQNKLEQEGYKQVHDVNFGPEGINAKAVKDGKEWFLVVDSSGKILKREAR